LLAAIFARVLGIDRVGAHDSFFDLGGDSLTAMRAITTINTTFATNHTVRTLFNTPTITTLAQLLDADTEPADPLYSRVHHDVAVLHAAELTLDKFIDGPTLHAAPNLRGPGAETRCVLLTGATGFLGRYLVLEWLERLDLVDGTLICLVRADTDEDARRRLDETFDSGDPALLQHYRALADGRLQVIAGDKGEPDLGLDPQTWKRLAAGVDAIVDAAAVVNGALPYRDLFRPNVVGTAELIRLAVTGRLKQFLYVSTANVGDQVVSGHFTEDADIRVVGSTRTVDAGVANGYGNSKWAGEVLLREANDLCGLPVAVFRCDMLLADTTYAGQLNLSDTVTRMALSILATGIAPRSFYELDDEGHRQRAHFDGLPVEFVAEAITALGADIVDGFQTFHVMNPHDDGIGLDEYVDWLIEAGHPIQRVGDFTEWLTRLEERLRALPERQRRHSVLPMLAVRGTREPRPLTPTLGAYGPTDRFRAAVREAKLGPDKNTPDIPKVSAPMILKYATDLRLLGLL
ncbi:thioester reductase domain-containing protein, partial [Mycobacterium sp. Y57]|uniref:thioester reductase domain-containing protein n=1 Tax=Mycolicibacterium xanthum TaxID=2796469 RepID=UPI001C842D06